MKKNEFKKFALEDDKTINELERIIKHHFVLIDYSLIKEAIVKSILNCSMIICVLSKLENADIKDAVHQLEAENIIKNPSRGLYKKQTKVA